MNLDLTHEEAAALLREHNNIIENDRYPLSPRIGTLRDIRAKLRWPARIVLVKAEGCSYGEDHAPTPGFRSPV